MENEELAKEWYVTHEGRQFGPVSMDDLKYEAERGELNPRLDMIWKNGMEDWIPAGDLDGLFEKNREAADIEKAKEAPATAIAKPEKKNKKTHTQIPGEWEGTGRSAFLFISYVLPFLLVFGISLGAPLLAGKIDQNIIGIVGTVAMFVLSIMIIFVSINRFPNLAMSRWWWFGLMVPFLNFWVSYRMIACPAGYAEHKKLDTVGWILSIFYWLVIAFFAIAFLGIIFVVVQSPQDYNSPEAIEKLVDNIIKDLTKR
jgi:hypothetical protein